MTFGKVRADAREYTIELANGLRMTFAPGPDTGQWVDELARVMQLQPSRGLWTNKTVFVRTYSRCCFGLGSPGHEIGSDIQTLPYVRVMAGSVRGETICEIGPPCDEATEYRRMQFALSPLFAAVHGQEGFVIHGALVAREGRGAIITAPCGTGKSTSCRRLPPDWEVLSDDSAIIVPVDGGFAAHPLPTWSDYILHRRRPTWCVEQHVPLSAIFFLQRSDTDGVEPIGAGPTALLLRRSVSYVCMADVPDGHGCARVERELALFERSCVLARRVPGFLLNARLDGSFWEHLAKTIEGPT